MAIKQEKPSLQRINLRAVSYADFRRSSLTLYLEWAQENPSVRMGPDDAVCFISGTGTQLLFVRRMVQIRNVSANRGKDHYTIVPSIRLRLDTHWHPWMLAHYAESCGFDVGLKRFKQYFDEARARRREEHAE